MWVFSKERPLVGWRYSTVDGRGSYPGDEHIFERNYKAERGTASKRSRKRRNGGVTMYEVNVLTSQLSLFGSVVRFIGDAIFFGGVVLVAAIALQAFLENK